MKQSQRPTWKLTASVDDQLTEKQRSRKAWEQRRLAEGLCVRCGKARGAERQDVGHCLACARSMNDQRNRARHGRPLRLKGPKAVDRVWNYGTDDLITMHIPVAKRLAWKAWRRVGQKMDANDVIGEALYGLVKAGRTFHPERDIPFEAWAVLKIRNAIWHGVKRWTCGYQKRPPVFVGLRDVEDGVRRRYMEVV